MLKITEKYSLIMIFRCYKAICKPCSGISSSEVRSVLLQIPVLLAWCKCLASNSSVSAAAVGTTPVSSKEIVRRVKLMMHDLLDIYENKVKIKLDLIAKNIYDTNKELVNILLNKLEETNIEVCNSKPLVPGRLNSPSVDVIATPKIIPISPVQSQMFDGGE